MAQYKVPQDVEAEDKLIGPFSFRQFIYLGVAAMAIGAMVGLWQLFPGLIIIPLPVALLFLVLALPLRKDQPMEAYLTAVIRFFLKPHRRLWQPEGSASLVTIVAPKTTERQLTKGLGGAAAAAQLDYLSQVIDTQGWASRGVLSPTISMNDTVYAEAQQVEDVLDENAAVSRAFDSMIDKNNDTYKQSLLQRFRDAASKPSAPTSQAAAPAAAPSVVAAEPTTAPVAEPIVTPPAPTAPAPTPAIAPDEPVDFNYNPYPANMHQRVVSPIDSRSPQSAVRSPRQHAATTDQGLQTTDSSRTSEKTVSPDIMRLANNNDLSISAIANEAHRLSDKDSEEVVINLH